MTEQLTIIVYGHPGPELPAHIQRGIKVDDRGCWLWMRSRSRDGYGWASLKNKTHQAHRLVYTLLRGVPSDGMQLDHLCRVRHCVNPEHLQPVTNLQNQMRSPITPAGRTVCAQGHGFIHNGHQRRCPVCLEAYLSATRERRIEYLRAYRLRRKAAA